MQNGQKVQLIGNTYDVDDINAFNRRGDKGMFIEIASERVFADLPEGPVARVQLDSGRKALIYAEYLEVIPEYEGFASQQPAPARKSRWERLKDWFAGV